MIKIQDLNFDYGTDDSMVFQRVNLEFQPGEIALVCGPTGSGKSTLLKLINRLSPNFTSGRCSGLVWIGEKEISSLKPSQVAPMIGYVNQQPDNYFVSESVIEELAFGMEQLGFGQERMKLQIDEVAELLGIKSLLEKELEHLSAGQQQRVAIGAALAAGQKILLLDEPTSALDIESAQVLLSTLRKLADEQMVTVLISEHRFERVLPFADSLVILKGDGSAKKATPTIEALSSLLPTWLSETTTSATLPLGEIACSANELSVTYPHISEPAVENASFEIFKGEIVAIQGPNGSGKTSLLMALAGYLPLAYGEVRLDSAPTVVPQNSSDLLFLSSVSKELSESDALAGMPAYSTSRIFESLIGPVNPKMHPRDLSVGQQLALVISMQITNGADILILDEPTRGLDNWAKNSLINQMQTLSATGSTIIIATHDEEFADRVANRKFEMLNGRLTTEKPVAS